MISILSHWGRRRAPRWCQFRPRQGGKLKNQREVRRHRLFGPPRSSLRDTLRRTRYLVTRILFMFHYESFTSVSLSNVFLLSGNLNGFLIFVTERWRNWESWLSNDCVWTLHCVLVWSYHDGLIRVVGLFVFCVWVDHCDLSFIFCYIIIIRSWISTQIYIFVNVINFELYSILNITTNSLLYIFVLYLFILYFCLHLYI